MSGFNPASGVQGGVRPGLIAVDLDGTLLNSNSKLTPRNARALQRAYDRGAQISIATGRRYSVARRLTQGIPCPYYLITNAGAWIASSSGEILGTTPWEAALLAAFLHHLGPLAGHVFLITDTKGRGEILCGEPNLEDRHVSYYVERNTQWLVKTNPFQVPEGSTVLQIVCVGTIQRSKRVHERALEFDGIEQLSVLETVYADRDLELIDVISHDAGKGNSLAKLAQMLSIDRECVMAIGDNYADASMLEFAGSPVVMGNAPSELRRRWPITSANDEDGVALAIETVLLL